MAFLSGVGNTPQYEAIAYYHWLIMLQLLEAGISWDAIQEMTENQIHMLLGVVSARKQKEADAQARSQASQMRM